MDQGVIYHKGLKDSGKWTQMSFYEQMANIGSEISRACRWKRAGKADMMQPAFERGLELLDFTIEEAHGPKLRELLRLREVMCDFFVGENEYGSTEEGMKGYFDAFALALRSI